MIGDKIVVYDPVTEKFFARWDRYSKAFDKDKPRAVWTHDIESAKMTLDIGWAHRAVKQIGGSVRVLSETKARQIDAHRRWREAQEFAI